MDTSVNDIKNISGIKARIVKKLRYELNLMLCLKNSGDIPAVSGILLGLALAYLLSPIDLIPDFIPIIGAIDDVIIVVPLLFLAYKLISEDVISKCKIKINGEVDI